MLKFVCKSRHVISAAAKASPTHVFYFHQTAPFFTPLKSFEKSSNQQLFTVTYLINSCGLSPEKALLASRRVKFETPDKPDSVLAFFRNHGFTQTQISSAIRNHPPLLLCDPQKTLLPKLEFLKSKGLSSVDVARITSTSQFLLTRSLENSIIPSFHFFCNLLQSEERTLAFIRRCGLHLWGYQSQLIPNIEILQKAGVPITYIRGLLMKEPGAFTVSNNRFRECVDEAEKMGFNSSTARFMLAIHALTAMSKSTWEKKVEVYKKWGWTHDNIIVAFRRNPCCMMASEDKITRVMDFLVNKMGWESSLVARHPIIISLSLEKRIVPRSAVYQALFLQGLIRTSDSSFTTWLKYPENQFLKKVLSFKEEEATDLYKLYNQTLDLAK